MVNLIVVIGIFTRLFGMWGNSLLYSILYDISPNKIPHQFKMTAWTLR